MTGHWRRRVLSWTLAVGAGVLLAGAWVLASPDAALASAALGGSALYLS